MVQRRPARKAAAQKPRRTRQTSAAMTDTDDEEANAVGGELPAARTTRNIDAASRPHLNEEAAPSTMDKLKTVTHNAFTALSESVRVVGVNSRKSKTHRKTKSKPAHGNLNSHAFFGKQVDVHRAHNG